MADYIVMPTLGFDMEEGTMGPWLKNIGDAVAVGDVLAEIESDKVTQELTARAGGVVLAIFCEQGSQVPVGANMGVIGQAGEDVSGMTGGAAPAAAPVVEEAAPEAAAPVAAAPVASSADTSAPTGVKATPVARRIAADKGIDLTQVVGTGPGGRIVKADVEGFSAPAPVAAAPVAPVATKKAAGPDSYEEALPKVRKAIAKRMVESKTTIPHFYLSVAIDMAPALAFRKTINASMPEGEKVSVNDMVVKACGVALAQYPKLNASWNVDSLIMHENINVGTAVPTNEGGLLTVVQKNTDSSTISKVARDNKGMIARARTGKVEMSDIMGSTFTVSNLGPFDIEQFIAIVNPPEAAILAVGSAVPTPVVRDGEIVVANIMKATLSADHRVTDGAEAAQFLKLIKDTLQNPMQLLI